MDKPQTPTLALELRLESEIDKHLDDIVKLAETQIETSGIGKSERSQIQPTQFRNALATAMSTSSSFEAIKNWLRYQAGRDKGFWPLKLVEGVIKDCENLKNTATKIVEQVPDAQVGTVHVQLIRLYFGYLIRDYTYQRKLVERR
jgi:hypothetical protein